MVYCLFSQIGKHFSQKCKLLKNFSYVRFLICKIYNETNMKQSPTKETEKVSDKNVLDIISLVKETPLTKLSETYQSKFMTKLQERFTDDDEQLFLRSFYCYLNYHSTKDYVIDMDKIWEWLGFTRKDHCKRLLEKEFKENIDFVVTVFAPPQREAKNKNLVVI